MVYSLIAASVFGLSSGTARAQSSSTFALERLVENQGSGFRSSETQQLTGDTIGLQPVESSASSSFSLQGWPLVTSETDRSSCGIFVNGNAPLTNLVDVELSLICGHATGCSMVELSNNGVGWSGPFPYSISRPWTLVANDGTRRVFARFQNGLGNWSGVCNDSIALDRSAPGVTLSPVGGTFMSPQSVTITASEPATIRYTTDGTDPKTSPTALDYNGPVSVSSNTTLQAYATDTAGNAGAVATEVYEICSGGNLSISGTVTDATVNLPMPLVRITLNTGAFTDSTPQGNYSFTGLPRGWYTIVSVTTPTPGYVTYQSEIKLCQSPVSKDIVLTRDATVFGIDTNAGYSADGVNTSTGNFAYKITDLAIPGRGPSFVFERSYNSQDSAAGPLGYGWTWNYNTSLSTGPGGEVVVRWGDGKVEVWGPDGSGGFEPMYGVFSTLIQNPDTTFTLRRKDRVEFRFNPTGRLAQVADEYGNVIGFSYSGPRITTITDTAGRVISLSYDASDRITNVLDPIGRSVSFAYDVNGDLVSATDLGGEITTYAYDAGHQMRSMTDPRGNVAFSMVYDTSRRVVTSQRDALGGETRYVYDVPKRTTSILDAMGNTTYHEFDELLRLVREEDPRGFEAIYAYDARGNMESATDKRGNVTTFAYDANGNVLAKTEPLGRITSATYDAASNPLTRTDPRGFSEVFEYDPGNGNLLIAYHCGAVPAASCAGDPGVTRTEYVYDPLSGKVATITEAAGNPALERATTYQYDLQGNLVTQIDALGSSSTFTYDGVGRKLTENYPLGRASAYEYDAMDRLLSVTDALGGQAQFTYDANGNKVEHLDARGSLTIFGYDAKDRLVSRTDPLGRVETYSYDPLDRRDGVTNPRGATSSVIYDPMGNVLQEIDALGSTVSHEYDGNGNRTATTDAKGNRTTFAYDELNRLVSTTDPLGNIETYEYDLNGNRTKVTDPLGRETTSTFDAFNRLASVSDPLGNTVVNTYEGLGRLVGVQDARGATTSFEYDALDRLIQVTDGAGGIVTATYDPLGNRTSVTDPRGNTTTFEYDLLNRLVTETDPLGHSTVRTYDAVGNLVSLTNADGVTSYTYDTAGQLAGITYPDSTTADFTYDANGNRVSTSDLAGSTLFTYDVLDRLSAVTDPFGWTVGYTHDPDGNRTSIRYPGNRSVTYLYDAGNRLTSVEDWGGVRTLYSYNEAGELIQTLMGNGALVSYDYDGAGRLVQKTDQAPGGQLISSYVLSLDANGNPTSVSFSQPLMPDPGAVDQMMAFGAANQVVSSNDLSFSYDANGSRLARSGSQGSTTYGYDFNERLTSVDDGSSPIGFTYGSDGKRLSLSSNGNEVHFLVDRSGELEWVLGRTNGSTALSELSVYGDGLLYQYAVTGGERVFFHYDSSGNATAATNGAGEVIASFSVLPFGEQTKEVGSTVGEYRFQGKLGVERARDDLYFMRARYYDAEVRAFLTVDPVRGDLARPETLNSYSYAAGNPILKTDPSGATFVLGTTPWALLRPVARFARFPTGEFWKIAEKCALCIPGPPPEDLVPGLKEIFGEVETTTLLGPLDTGQVSAWTRSYSIEERGSPGSRPEPTAPSGKAARRPKVYLGAVGFARSYFNSELARVLAPGFLDAETRSLVELAIEYEVAELSTRRYGYRQGDSESKRRAKAQRDRDVAASASRFYSQLVSALSKHEVIVRDLSELPRFSTGGIRKGGVYGGI